jgi:hypothetical protein
MVPAYAKVATFAQPSKKNVLQRINVIGLDCARVAQVFVRTP